MVEERGDVGRGVVLLFPERVVSQRMGDDRGPLSGRVSFTFHQVVFIVGVCCSFYQASSRPSLDCSRARAVTTSLVCCTDARPDYHIQTLSPAYD